MKLKKKSIFHFLVIICSVLFITIVSLVPINTTKSGSKWMSQVEDNYNIVDLSIPGTHDSGATHSIFDVAGKCQELSIKSQLNIGVRFLDIRLQLVNDDLNVVHSFVDQNLKFTIGTSMNNCTGCGLCSNICPGKNKEKAIHGSIGYATVIEGDTFETLFSRADKALYCVKRNGKNNYACYSPEMENEG